MILVLEVINMYGYIAFLIAVTTPVITLSDGSHLYLGSACSRNPVIPSLAHRRRSDGHFLTSVVDGENHIVDSYVVGQTYSVDISSSIPGQTFVGFYLVAVAQHSAREDGTIGQFRNTDNHMTTFAVNCPHVVTSVDLVQKSLIRVQWTAPETSSGCIEFRTTVFENEHVWYRDDGKLTKILCEHVGHEDIHHNIQPSNPLPECCACGKAKYHLIFHGLWPQRSQSSEHLLRRNVLRWSSVIGASHSQHYAMWNYGRIASRGVAEVCEYGDTRLLEEEMHQQSNDIRTVIKTPGMNWSDVLGVEQRLRAYFSTDRKHHFLSVLSRVSPSPDWCIGVSNLDLCLSNCSWANEVTMELTPWDAGISDGSLYIAERQRSSPAQPIHRLNNTFPDDPTSPYYGMSHVKPMAVLRLRRDPKQNDDMSDCSNQDHFSSSNTEFLDDLSLESFSPNVAVDDYCQLSPWSAWSECSAKWCGSGVMTRTRSLLHRGSTASCRNATVSEDQPCQAAVDCATFCSVGPWSSWSTCSQDGAGPCVEYNVYCTRRRHRTFVHNDSKQVCNETTDEEETCSPASSTSSPSPLNAVRCNLVPDAGSCEGHSVRKWYHDVTARRCRSFRYSGCRGNGNRFDSELECIHACIGDAVLLQASIASSTQTPNTTSSHSVRWLSRSESVDSHRSLNEGTTPMTTDANRQQQYLPSTSSKPGRVSSTPSSAAAVDCVLSSWSSWTRCSATCGEGAHRVRRRLIEISPRSGGRNCSRKLEQQRPCRLASCDERTVQQQQVDRCQYRPWSSWSSCARSCGADSVQERVRRLSQPVPLADAEHCVMKVERRLCALPLCSSSPGGD